MHGSRAVRPFLEQHATNPIFVGKLLSVSEIALQISGQKYFICSVASELEVF